MLVIIVEFYPEDQTNDEKTAQYDRWRRKGALLKRVTEKFADIIW